MKKILLPLLTLLLPALLFSQSYNARFAKDIIFTEAFGKKQTDYIFYMKLNTAALVSAGKMQSNGNDIRFVADCGQNTYYDYYIHRGMNTANTEIFVKIPTIDSSSTDTITMLYGDSTAAAGSNFNKCFPNAIVSNGNNLTRGGVVNAGWIDIQSGDTLSLSSNNILELKAGYVNIAGVISGIGNGFQGSTSSFTAGAGPGGGKVSPGSNSGCGGGGYGGVGGKGGYDNISSDPPGVGGLVNGNDTTIEINKGSAATGSYGGHGGGGIIIQASLVNITGAIFMDGTGGVGGSFGQNAGGGSGGGVLVRGDSVKVATSASFSAKGGIGASGTSTANDGGGGGGGGRIKIFGSSSVPSTVNANVLGGAGGNYGTPIGETGDTGTVFTKTIPFPSYSFGSETAAGAYSVLSTRDSVCPGDTATLSVTNASTVLWSNSDTTFTTVVSPLVTTTYYASGMSTTGCVTTDSTTIFVPQLFVDLGPDTSNCGPITIDAVAASGVNYLWSNSDTTATTLISSTGTYSVTATQGGCSYADTIFMRIDTIPVVSVIPVFDTICYGTSTVINGYPTGGTLSGSGITGNTFYSASAGYGIHQNTYVFSDANGCADTSYSTIYVSVTPTLLMPATVQHCGPTTLSATPNSGAKYRWNSLDSTRVISVASSGMYIVTATLGNCSVTDTTVAQIDTIPIVTLTIGSDTLCLSDSTQLTGLPSGGTYSGTAVSNGKFYSGTSGIGTFNQFYYFADANGCFSRDTTKVFVKPIPTVTLTAPSFSICIGDTMLVSTTPAGGTISGTGLSGHLFNSNTSGVGSFPLQFSFSDNNGCSNTISRNMVVHALPTVSLSSAVDSM